MQQQIALQSVITKKLHVGFTGAHAAFGPKTQLLLLTCNQATSSGVAQRQDAVNSCAGAC